MCFHPDILTSSAVRRGVHVSNPRCVLAAARKCTNLGGANCTTHELGVEGTNYQALGTGMGAADRVVLRKSSGQAKPVRDTLLRLPGGAAGLSSKLGARWLSR